MRREVVTNEQQRRRDQPLTAAHAAPLQAPSGQPVSLHEPLA